MKRRLIIMGILLIVVFLVSKFLPHLSFAGGSNDFISGALKSSTGK